ncbi:MAG: hypothetical protein KF684_13605 [Phycisphaeraceae bacterium]|jgi:hypothetical protein|nr:hypothetical protein [Phycisphaeraceae bacterium]
MSTDLASSQPVPDPSEPKPDTATPDRNRRNWVGWLLAATFVALLFVELGPWPGLITNTLGLSVSSRTAWRDDAGVSVPTSPRAPTYRTGRRLSFNDAELAEFARHCDAVLQTFQHLDNQNAGDYSAVRRFYGDRVPELFTSLTAQLFPEANAIRWKTFLELDVPPRMKRPSDFIPFYEDLMLAGVTRQLTTGHLSEVVRYIDWWKAAAVKEDAYRRSALSLADYMPVGLRPQTDLRPRWQLSGLDGARQFMVDKLERGNVAGPGLGEDAQRVPTPGEPSGSQSPP